MKVGTVRGAVALLALTAGLALAATAIGSSTDRAAIYVYATLDGSNEVPGPGDPNGIGSAEVKLRKAAGRICALLEWARIDDPVAAHIHKGGRNDSGPVKVELFAGEQSSPFRDCVKAPRRLIKRIINKPERFYVNIHNADFPDGAIRGQLVYAVG